MPPETFDIDNAVEWSRWVLENGLPVFPRARLALGESVPVAYWVGPTTAAVLHIQRVRLDEDEGGEEITETDLDLFCLVDERWELFGGGGAGPWQEHASPFERPSVASGYVELGGMNSGSGGERGCKALWGVVGADATAAEVHQAGRITRRTLDVPVGLVVVSGEYSQPMTVRVLTKAGDVLAVIDEPAGDDW
jgi:hypothetical protein